MFSLEGKKALVTGASGGIGSAIAKNLADQGAVVGLSGTREGKLQEVAGSIGGETHILPCNLSDVDAVKALPGQATDAMGGLDILVCNAGVTRDGLAMRMSEEDWDAVLDVNLKSTFLLIQASLRGLMKQRYGRIIGITSIVGVMGNPGQANYCASKAGMIGMIKSLAAETASRGITANCVAPGFIQTAMTDELSDDQKAKMTGAIPAGAMGQPEDIANAVSYLASQEASYITGQTLHINGGMLMV